MKSIDTKSIKRIGDLRKKGYSYKEIANNLQISVGSSYKYANEVKVTETGKKRLGHNVGKNRKIFVERFAKMRKINKPNKVTTELVRILGHCLFDGCVKKDGVTYTNSSLSLINEFRSDMCKVFSLKPSKLFKLRNKNDYYVLYYNYKDLSDYLFKIAESFSTSKSSSKKVIDFVSNLKKKKINEFLRTFWDDEGAVKICKDVTAKTKSRGVAKALANLHQKAGIDVNIYWDKKNEAYELYLVRNKENISSFKDNVGFRYGLVSRGNFAGLTKLQAFNSIVS